MEDTFNELNNINNCSSNTLNNINNCSSDTLNNNILNTIDNCCLNPSLCKNTYELICINCGMTFDNDELYYFDLNYKNIYYNNSIKLLSKKNNVKTFYTNNTYTYKYVRFNDLFNYLREKNQKSSSKIHENILKQSVEYYIKITKNKILRANNKIECLSYILFCKCIDFNIPKTITFIVNYMGLPKGGFSRGLKKINSLLNENTDNNPNLLINKNDDLIKLKSYTHKLLLSNNTFINIDNLIPIIIKLYNFTNKLGVFNEFRNDTKIAGCIFYITKLKNIHIDNMFFKNYKIEKNTVKKFYKKIYDSIYNSYYIQYVNDEFNKFNNFKL